MDTRTEIERLLYEYARRVDRGDFDGVGDLFRRGVYRAAVGDDTTDFAGADAVRRLLTETVRVRDDGTPGTQHVVTNVVVDVDEAHGTATGYSSFTVLQAGDDHRIRIVAAGRYEDRFARSDAGEWHFAERLIRTDLVGDLSGHLRGDPFGSG